MSNPEPTYDCPVCLGIKLKKIKLSPTSELLLDYCPRCNGMWFDRGEVQQLQHFNPKALTKEIILKKEAFSMRCHSCFSAMDRNVLNCPTCKWKNILNCPGCTKLLKRMTVQDFALDVCYQCKGVWFDQIELAQLWNLNLSKLSRNKDSTKVRSAETAELFLDVFLFDPNLILFSGAMIAETGTTVLKAAGEVLTNAPEVTGSVIEGAGDVAAAIFEAIASILGDIF